MLEKLLDLLKQGGSHRIVDLANALDTTPALVDAMLEDLGRMGYIRSMEASCGASCDSCPMSGLCASGSNGRVWVLTEKGSGCCTGDVHPDVRNT
jgi:predicted ArsR family transcriptional regulator